MVTFIIHKNPSPRAPSSPSSIDLGGLDELNIRADPAEKDALQEIEKLVHGEEQLVPRSATRERRREAGFISQPPRRRSSSVRAPPPELPALAPWQNHFRARSAVREDEPAGGFGDHPNVDAGSDDEAMSARILVRSARSTEPDYMDDDPVSTQSQPSTSGTANTSSEHGSDDEESHTQSEKYTLAQFLEEYPSREAIGGPVA